jgi:hypothetical protein
VGKQAIFRRNQKLQQFTPLIDFGLLVSSTNPNSALRVNCLSLLAWRWRQEHVQGVQVTFRFNGRFLIGLGNLPV